MPTPATASSSLRSLRKAALLELTGAPRHMTKSEILAGLTPHDRAALLLHPKQKRAVVGGVQIVVPRPYERRWSDLPLGFPGWGGG
jgi:hypothetical protein